MRKYLYTCILTWFALMGVHAEVVTGPCGAEEENLVYTLDKDTKILTISGKGAMKNYTFKEYGSESDPPWRTHSSFIETLIIEEGVTSIGNNAFNKCEQLAKATIPTSIARIGIASFSACIQLDTLVLPNTIKKIGSSAFSDCKELSSINLPTSLDTISYNLFGNCYKLTSLTIPPSIICIERQAFRNAGLQTQVLPNSVTTLGDYAFQDCPLVSVTVPNSIRTIGTGVFNHCRELTEPVYNATHFIYLPFRAYGWDGNIYIKEATYDIPEGITTVCSMAFEEIEQRLVGIKLPNSLTRIENYAFNNCGMLRSLIIPPSVKYIGAYAFNNCGELNCSIDIPNGITRINEGTFYGCKKLSYVRIPDSVTEIGLNAFSGCSNMYSISLPPALRSLESYAFRNCTKLESINIPNSLTDIQPYAFEGCPNLNIPLYNTTRFIYLPPSFEGEYSIPQGIQIICPTAFSQCDSLTAVTIPQSMTRIEDFAFSGCTRLQEAEIPAHTTYIGNGAFSGCSQLRIMLLPDAAQYVGYSAFSGCSSLSRIELPTSLSEIQSYTFADCAQLDSVIIPHSVTSIGYDAFNGCTSLTYVEIPSSVTEINSGAFRGCSQLIRVQLPASVNSLSSNAFSQCASLEFIHVDKNNPAYTSINGVVFNKEKTKIVTIPRGIKSILIPETITELEEGFLKDYTQLEELTLPFIGETKYTQKYPQKLFAYLFKSTTDHPSYSNTYTYTYEIPATLRKLTFTCDTIDIKAFDTYSYTEKPYNTTKYYYHKTKNLEVIDTLILQNVKHITGGLLSKFFAQAEAVYITYKDAQELEPGLFAGLHNLKSLTLPFPGAGTAATVGNFGELFGTTRQDNMRAVTQFFENGDNRTYYLPTGLEEVTISEGCELIPYGGLYNCSMIKKLTLPISLYMMGEKALYGCAGLKDIYCKGADPAVAFDNTFEGMRISSCKLHIPYNTTGLYKRSTGWKNFYYFEEEAPLTISVAKNIEKAGVIYGLNEYQPGATAELKAVANSGYAFSAWTENGTVISQDAFYTSIVTDSRQLVAVFTPIQNQNTVQTSPGAGNVRFTWETEEGADTYLLTVYADEAMTQPVGSTRFDANGTPMATTGATATLSAVIEGLETEKNYVYSITAYTEADIVLAQYTGTFTTLITSIAETGQSSLKCTVCEGGIRITQATGKTLQVTDIQGREVCRQLLASDDMFIPLPQGIFILNIEGKSFKIAVK